MKTGPSIFGKFGRVLSAFALVAAITLWPGVFKVRADQPMNSPTGNEHPDFFAMKTKDGLLLVSNSDHSPFMVRVRGKSVRQGTMGEGDNQFNVMQVDGLLVQFTTAGISQFFDGDSSKLTDAEAMKKHMEWEKAYIEKSLGHSLSLKMNINVKYKGKRTYLFWEYDMPHPAKEGVKSNLMVVARVKNSIMVLNGMLVDPGDEKALMGKLFETAYTLVEAPQPITINQARGIALKD
jgi:hypothetical protein